MGDELKERVFMMVATQTGHRRAELSLQTNVFRDLGVDGDDAEDLLIGFSKEFDVDLKRLQFSRHFGPEAPFNPIALLMPRWWRWQRERIPVRMQDLVDAAASREWTIRYPEEQAA